MSTRRRPLPEVVRGVAAARGWQLATESTHASDPDRSQLVFVGNWQDPCPRRLLFDVALEPVDIVTWQIVRLHADPAGMVAFPRYVDLMRLVRVSRATVARSLTVLRLTGWLPLCAALRDSEGRFAGHVYALNDEPVPVEELLELDPCYVPFVEQARAHRSAHVRSVALERFEHLRTVASSDLEPVRVRDQLAGRLEAMLALLGRVQNLNVAPRSSSVLEDTTTTARRTAESPAARHERVEHDPTLVIPKDLALTESQGRVLLMRLGPLPPAQAQDVLDEAAGRVRLKRRTRDPVRCEFDYAARLAAKALAGEFLLTDAGARVRRDREERAAGEARLDRARAASEAEGLKTLAAQVARRR